MKKLNNSMKTVLTYLIVFFVFASNTLGQKSNSIITGTLKETSGAPAAFVTVILLDMDSTMVKMDFSKENGSFSFPNIEQGEYKVQVSSVQYKHYISQSILISEGQHLTLDPIEVEAAVKELDEVTVKASKPLVEVQPDRTVFNVEGSPNASGNTGFQLLRKSPGVIIDNNDNIILQGKSGVRIFIDGKPSQLSGEDLTTTLRSMQSEQIEAIEIITNPPAKYEAQGNAGIINIKLKRDKNLGTNASINTGYDVHIRERYRAGIAANHRTKKLSLFGNYEYYNIAGQNFFVLKKELNSIYQHSNSTINRNVKGHGFRGGADYYINKHHTIGVVVNGNINDRTTDNFTKNRIAQISNRSSIDSVLIANNNADNDTDNINSNFNYQYKGKKGSAVNIDLNYGKFTTSGYTVQPNEYKNPSETKTLSGKYYTNYQNTKIDIKTAKLDYEVNLGKGRFSAGTKYGRVVTDNSFKFYNHIPTITSTGTLDIQRSSDFNYDERVLAIYSNYAIKLNDQVNINLGMRMENTKSVGTLQSQTQPQLPVSRSYTDFFPSGGLTYSLSKTNQFGLNYSRRIDRPSYQKLNPFEFRLDELSYRVGNPYLQPQYTHSFQLTHTYKYKLNTRLSYSFTSDFFGQVTEIVQGTNASIIKQQNLSDATNIGLNISYPFNVTKWWSGYSSLNLNYASFKSQITRDFIDINATTYNVYIQNNFMLPKGFKFELSGWYNSPSIWGGTIFSGRIYSINAGLQKSVFKDMGNFTIGIDDIFFTQQWTGESNYGGLKIDANGGRDSRRFKVGLTYRIGNQRVKSRRRKTGQEAEQKRIQQGNDTN